MTDLISINQEQRLYVLKCGDGYSCLGFDVAEKRRLAYLAWLRVPTETGTVGTPRAYEAYRAAEDAVVARVAETGKRCPALLEPRLIGLENKRVEVTAPDGTRERFYVGKSTGPIPIHLEIKGRDSSGGGGVYVPEGATVRVVGQR